MVVGALMEVVPFPEKTLQRLIAVVGLNVLYLDQLYNAFQELMVHAGSQNR